MTTTTMKTRTTKINARHTTKSHDGNGNPVLMIHDGNGKCVEIQFKDENALRRFVFHTEPLARLVKTKKAV